MIDGGCRTCGREPCACASRSSSDTVTRDLELELLRELEGWIGDLEARPDVSSRRRAYQAATLAIRKIRQSS